MGLRIPPSSKGALPGASTGINPSSFNVISVGLSSSIWDLNQVLICSALVKIPALIFADAGPHPAGAGDGTGCLLLPQRLAKSVLHREAGDAFTRMHRTIESYNHRIMKVGKDL